MQAEISKKENTEVQDTLDKEAAQHDIDLRHVQMLEDMDALRGVELDLRSQCSQRAKAAQKQQEVFDSLINDFYRREGG